MNESNIQSVLGFFKALQDQISDSLSAVDGKSFFEDPWQREGGGGGRTRVLRDGHVFEQAGVAFSHVMGDQLPPAASQKRPHLAGAPWQAMGVSVVIHPRNPMIPTSHMNVRMFYATPKDAEPVWWFGGGFDLTPFYPRQADCVHWHQCAADALAPFGEELYPEFKRRCDDYFYLKHRNEARGIGGIFYDDFNHLGFEQSFAMTQAVGQAFGKAYIPIVKANKERPYNAAQREFQRYRRGRYIEFNLVWDRGTIFGLQSGGRSESILMSMPPDVRFEYGYTPTPGSEEAALYDQYLPAQDWI